MNSYRIPPVDPSLPPSLLLIALDPHQQASSTEKNRQQLEIFVNQLLFQPAFIKDNDVLRFFEIKPVVQGQAEVPEEVGSKTLKSIKSVP